MGGSVELDRLALAEVHAFFSILELAGGPGILQGPAGAPVAEEAKAEQAPIEPDLFRGAKQATLRRILGEAAPSPCLASALEDLDDRIVLRYSGSSQHDPAYFLHKLYSELGSLQKVTEKTGIDRANLSRLLRREGGVSLEKLRMAAATANVAFGFRVRSDVREDTAERLALEGVAVRDCLQQMLGQRLLAFAACALPDAFTGEVLWPEFRARGGDDRVILSGALARAKTYLKELGISGALNRCHIVVLAGLPQEEQRWLFLAVELGWFEEYGFVVALCQEEWTIRRISSCRGLQVSATNVPIQASTPVLANHWSTLLDAYLREPLVLPGEGSKPAPVGIAGVLGMLRQRALLLAADPVLAPAIERIAGRWELALPPASRTVTRNEITVMELQAKPNAGAQARATALAGLGGSLG